MNYRRFSALICILLTLGFYTSLSLANSSGPPDSHAANPANYSDCSACHNSFPVNSGLGTIFMVTMPISYTSGGTMPVDISVADPFASRWGFEMTVIDWAFGPAGQFIVVDPIITQLSTNPPTGFDFMKQTSAGTFQGAMAGVAWPILWNAPVGPWPVTFYFAGIAANNDGTPIGDYVYTDSLIVNAASAVYVQLTPTGTTTFNASGGVLNWDITIESWSGLPTDPIDIWVDVTLPNGVVFGPILGPIYGFPMPGIPPPVTITRSRFTNIPPGAPTGNYMMNAYIGVYSPPNNQIRAEDHFAFIKTYPDGGEVTGDLTGFIDSGESFDDWLVTSDAGNHSSSFTLHPCSPNPFNPTTAISYQLSALSFVNLEVYDVNGRKVAELVNGWRDAGAHEVTFDASGLASGIYLYRLEALVASGSGTTPTTVSGKMVLMK